MFKVCVYIEIQSTITSTYYKLTCLYIAAIQIKSPDNWTPHRQSTPPNLWTFLDMYPVSMTFGLNTIRLQTATQIYIHSKNTVARGNPMQLVQGYRNT